MALSGDEWKHAGDEPPRPPEEIQFTCEVCGSDFDPTPDAMVEWNIEGVAVPGDSAMDIGLTRDELESLNEWEMMEMKLTNETRDALLAGKVVRFGGCICLPCQDAMLAAQDGDESEP